MATSTKSRAKPNANPTYSAAAYLANAVRTYGPESPEAEAARVESVTTRIEQAIRRLVAEAPPLPEENRKRLIAALNDPAGS